MVQFTREDLIQAIYGQESSHGKADTSKENYAGARGPMQVTHSTFEGLKNNGVIPKDWRHDNPEHTKEAGNRLVGSLYDKYGGDPAKVAAAYYAGEKAVRADGSIADYRDRKNPKAPTTLQYVSDIMRRLGAPGQPASQAIPQGPAAAPAAPTERANVLESWEVGMPGRQALAREPVTYTDKTVAPIGPSPRPTADGVVPIAEQVQAEEDALRKQSEVREKTPFLEMSKAAFIRNTFVGSVVVNNAMRAYEAEHAAVPGFTVDPKALAGMDSHEQEFIKQASSPAMLERIQMEIADRRADMQTINVKGTGMGIAATIFAGLPEGYLTGMGAMRAFQLAKVGSAQYAARGLRAAAVGSAVAENVGGNLALTAIQDAFDPYVSKDDYAMAAGMGMLGSVLNLPGLMKAPDGPGLVKAAEAMQEAAAASTLAMREKAVQNLGTSATPEQLIAEVRRLEANKVREELSNMSAPVPANRRLLPDSEELRIDAQEVAAKDAPVGGAQGAPVGQNFGYSSADPRWDLRNPSAMREEMARTNPKFVKQIAEIEGTSMAAADTLPSGVTVLPKITENVAMGPAVKAIRDLAQQFLPKDTKLIVGLAKVTDAAGGGVRDPNYNGVLVSAGKTHFLGLKETSNPTAAVTTGVHEVGHAVFHATVKDIPQELLGRMVEQHRNFLMELKAGSKGARFKRFAEGSSNILDDSGNVRDALPATGERAEYVASFDEYTAEAFVRFIQKQARTEGSKLVLDQGAVALLKSAWEKIKSLWEAAREKGMLPKDEPFEEYFQRVMDGTLAQESKVKAVAEEYLDAGLIANFDKGAPSADEVLSSSVAVKNGLQFLPAGTQTQAAEAKAIVSLYEKATKDGGYKVDEKRLSRLMDTAIFRGAQGTANTMLRSDNPVVRMVAAELLESAGGAGGRRSSAAIAKHINEKAYLGNTLNEVQGHYKSYRDSQGGSVIGDFFNGKQWQQFNRLVAEEIESRRPGAAKVESHASVKAAADSLEAAYERIRTAQVQAKTIGWAALPESSVGYMPHKLSPEKFINMTQKQEGALHRALMDQFINIEGFDITFAGNLASKYMDRVRVRATGGFDAPVGIHQTGAADIVQEALEQMGLGRAEVDAMMKRYMSGGAGHTKKRLALDLNEVHDLGDGESFKLMDLFETDHFRLLRSQAHRVSGEVALAGHGIMGKPGLALLRRAMSFGGDGQRAAAHEIEAFDQVAAEFMGEPFGTQNKLVDRVLQVNSLSRLGGMGFTQFAEGINGIFHVGAMRSLEAVSSMGRLRREIKALARGEKVDNPILGSLERYSGAEFGTEQYKTVFPFDNQSLEYHTYGKDTANAADRLLRGGVFVQGKLSMWRAIHSTQQRGFAEQIVRKAADFIKKGDNDAALRDMGITDDLIERLRKDIDNIAEFDGARLTNFDITKATDADAAKEFIQAIHRGTSQIIQGTFIGEQGKWAHDGIMRLMTQFRTFSLTSVEKQWARQVGNVGTAKTLGMMLGAMSMAAPIYMARTYLASVGRPDQEDYLEKQLTAQRIARASLNYIAMSGLAGDFLDATSAVTGIGQTTGGRSGAGTDFVGGVVAPAAGLVNDLWKGVQNTKEGTDPHELVKALPFSKLPFMIPAISALGD